MRSESVRERFVRVKQQGEAASWGVRVLGRFVRVKHQGEAAS